jgi:hypothetical protein
MTNPLNSRGSHDAVPAGASAAVDDLPLPTASSLGGGSVAGSWLPPRVG